MEDDFEKEQSTWSYPFPNTPPVYKYQHCQEDLMVFSEQQAPFMHAINQIKEKDKQAAMNNPESNVFNYNRSSNIINGKQNNQFFVKKNKINKKYENSTTQYPSQMQKPKFVAPRFERLWLERKIGNIYSCEKNN